MQGRAIQTTGIRLVTSNVRKLAEFHRFGLPFPSCAGPDLDEIDAGPVEVVAHKAWAAGEALGVAGEFLPCIVEDTSLEVAGADVGVNVRWLMDRLEEHDGAPAVWTVILGANLGDAIEIYQGQVHGTIRKPVVAIEDAFGFDPVFVPDGYDVSLAVLEKAGRKDEISARRLAARALIEGQPCAVFTPEQAAVLAARCPLQSKV